uniref:GH24370 n=1 Tax=Solanum tuberosum TaxID=4113 RepID=M1DAP1_SOLTU
MSDEFESDLPQSYENELSEHLMGPFIPEDDGEVPLVRTDVPETVIDMPSEEFVTQQLEVEYVKEFEDESEEEFGDEFEDEFEKECEDRSENEYEDDSEDESKDEFEDDTPLLFLL